MEPPKLLARIRGSVIGSDAVIPTPFGPRRITYADYTASGRPLAFVEDALRRQVMPYYANTHTESSGTGWQTTRFREDARDQIRASVGADRDEHAVVFAGSGSTAAIDRLVAILGLRIPARLDDRYDLSARIPEAERPVVLIGPYEHHSNVLAWRETIATVIEIDTDPVGHIDLDDLEARLVEHADRPLVIGSFSAASNVTGIVSDVPTITRLLHRHGALAFWDYAAAAPYVPIDVGSARGPGGDGSHLDAVFISPHKFIGGPGTPGVLVARRELLTNRVPSVPGGGTVSYVSSCGHVYLTDPEHREEGGTPGIIEAVRAGLVFRLKDEVGADTIHGIEESYARRALAAFTRHPRIRVLGNTDAERLSIISFVVLGPDHLDAARYLHHNFVVALLNDLFGIQARGGCSCAGPYGHRLLGIDNDTSERLLRAVGKGYEILKPGWVRLNFNYFIGEDEFRFLIAAIEAIADSGWRLLPDYRPVAATGIWRHRDSTVSMAGLADIDLGLGEGPVAAETPTTGEPAPTLFARYLAEARALMAARRSVRDETPDRLPGDVESLRWFLLPDEARPPDPAARP